MQHFEVANNELQETNKRQQQAELVELHDPRRRMEELQRLVIEPAMHEIHVLKGELSTVEIQRMWSYRIDEVVVDKLQELNILPPYGHTYWCTVARARLRVRPNLSSYFK